MKRKVWISILGTTIAVLLACAFLAWAAEYPDRPITLQVPFPSGSSSDVGARVVANIAEKELGRPIVVLNKAGAGGQVGWTELSRQKPDGYYLGMINLPHILTTILDPERKAVFKAEDIQPLISQALDPTVISVRADSPWKTVKDLVEEAKKKPGQIAAGIVGYLHDDEVGYFQFAEAAGIEFRRVYFDGSPPALNALLGKNVDVLFCTVGDNYAQWKSGRVRILMVMDQEKTKFYPDAPSAPDAGMPTVISASTRGIGAPKGIPEPIVKRLQEVLKKAMLSKEHMERLENAGQPVKIMVGEEFSKYYWDTFKVAKKWVDYVRGK